MSKLQQSMPLL